MRILVVEDESSVASIITRALCENAYDVDLAETGERAIELAKENSYDCILLDVRLPGRDGITVCRELRGSRTDIPILMLTARTLVEHRVEGLDAGADDYLTKPFAITELLARVRALLRRRIAGGRILRYADLELDRQRRRVTRHVRTQCELGDLYGCGRRAYRPPERGNEYDRSGWLDSESAGSGLDRDRFSDWQAPLLIMGGLYSVSATLWVLVDPRKRLYFAP